MKATAIAALLLGIATPGLAASIDDLLHAYPNALAGFDGADLIWRDGTRMAVDDGRSGKSMEDQLRGGSILDQLRMAYPAGAPFDTAPHQDPGRVRNRAFFYKMYGDCRSGEVAPTLVPIVWLPNTWGHIVRITSTNGVDRRLAEVSRELDTLPAEDKNTSIHRPAPIPAGRWPIPARRACTAGAPPSTSTPTSRIIGCGVAAVGTHRPM